MKQTFVAFFLIISCLSSMAQSAADMRRKWSEGALSWTDFKGLPTSDSALYLLDWSFLSKVEKTKVDGIHYNYVNFEASLDRTSSCYTPEMRNPQALKYCQLIFDLVEVHARKMTSEVAQNQELTIDEIFSYYTNQLRYRMNETKKSTQVGSDQSNLDLCCASVAQELKEAEFHPERVSYQGRVRGYDMYIGLLTSQSFSDYVRGTLLALNCGWNLAYSQHRFLGDIALGAHKKADRFISSDDFDIEEGESLSGGQMCLGYGYNFSSHSDRQCVPYVAFGMQFYSAKAIDEDSDTRELMGPTFNLGCYYDIPIRRVYDTSCYSLMSPYVAKVKHIHSIRIKPYIGLSHIPEFGSGWDPSINLSIVYSFSFYRILSQK